jgi:hypothetical protein
MATNFSIQDNWVGGAYEFVILIKPPSNQLLFSCMKTLWSHPSLEGCYTELARKKSQPKQNLSTITVDQFHPWDSFLGRATLPNKKSVVCYTSTYHGNDENQEPYPYDVDYLYFSIPIGALSKCYSIGAYPFDEGTTREWIKAINEWYFQICNYVYEKVPFNMAMIGGDCSPDFLIDPKDIEKISSRYNGFAISRHGKLIYYPATN